MIYHRKRTQFLRIGLQLLYISLPLLLLVMLYLWVQEVEPANLLKFLLGGLLCILLEALLLFRFFRRRIAEDSYDLVKLIREQVETLLGVVPLDLIEAKNRRKYYLPEQSLDSRLFDPRSEALYRTVTAHLRSEHANDYQPRVRALEEKCSLLQQRLKIMRSIYDFVIRSYDESSKVFAKVASRHKKPPYTQAEFWTLREPFERASQPRSLQALQAHLSLDGLSQSLSWESLVELIQQMGNIHKSSWREVTELCSSLLNVLELDIRNLNAELVKRLRSQYAGFRDNDTRLQELTQKVQEQSRRITVLQGEYQKVRKKHDAYEQELNAELNLELGRVELSNLNVKESNARDLRIRSAEELFSECEQAQAQLDHHEQTLDRNSRNIYKLLLEIEQRSARFVLRWLTKELDLKDANSESGYQSFSDRPSSPTRLGSAEFQVAKFRRLATSREHHKSFLKSFFELMVVEDVRRCEQVLASCQRLEREVTSYAGPPLLENSVVRVVRQLNENRLKFVNRVTQVLQNINHRTAQYDEELRVSRKAVDLLESTAYKQRSTLGKRPAGQQQQELQQYRLTEEQLAAKVSQMEGWSMGDAAYQLELLVAVAEQMASNSHYVGSEIANSESLEREQPEYESSRERRFRYYESLADREAPLELELPKDDIQALNKLLDVFFAEWREGQQFHRIIEKELYLAFNRKRPDILDEFVLEHFKIESKQTPLITSARVYPRSEAFHFLIDLDLHFVGLVCIAASSKIKIRNGIKLDLKIAVRKFVCPLRLCFTPLLLGKSYASFLAEPQLELELEVRIGNLSLHKIPLAGKLIKSLLLMKIRGLAMWPNRLSIKIPLSLKDTRLEAVRERLRFMREEEAKKKLS